jgi:hypothetical protein
MHSDSRVHFISYVQSRRANGVVEQSTTALRLQWVDWAVGLAQAPSSGLEVYTAINLRPAGPWRR